jgi:3-oxoacyl-[acyl-carrier-protein] synthase II
MALESAGIGAGFHSYSPERTAIMVGTSFGGIGSLIDEDRRTRDGTFRVSPRLVTRAIPSALASYLAIEYEVRGPVMTYLGACAASAQAIGEAMVSILVGRCDVALCGGADTLFVEPIMRSLAVTGALATLGPAESATHAVKPFGCERRGMALGEGAAFLVLERESAARARGSAVLAYLTGYGSGNDAYHVTAPEPSGFGAERVMRMALASADAQPSDVGYVSAHATGTEVGDIAEAAALGRVFVENPAVPVSSVKGALGHSLGAAGAIEAALAIQVLRTGWMPPNTGTDRPDDAAPRGILREATQIGPGGLVLSNSFGFGGHNVSLVCAPMED